MIHLLALINALPADRSRLILENVALRQQIVAIPHLRGLHHRYSRAAQGVPPATPARSSLEAVPRDAHVATPTLVSSIIVGPLVRLASDRDTLGFREDRESVQ